MNSDSLKQPNLPIPMVQDSPQAPRLRAFLRHLTFFALVGASLATAQVGGLDTPQAVAPYFNGIFPAQAPGSASGWTFVNAFPNLTFTDPMWLTSIPGTTDVLVATKSGILYRFPNTPTATAAQRITVLNISTRTQISSDQGFYKLVFHPQFGQAGSPNANYAYACYSHKPSLSGTSLDRSYWRVSRFTWLPASKTFDANSELVLIDQFDPNSWHNGGGMFFGNDGFLYITCGDGGGSDDGFGNAQTIDLGFFSGMLRIDVDNDPLKSHPIRRQPGQNAGKPAAWPNSSSKGYSIPNDNPWIDPNGSILEEFFAIGLRSPHTAHYDTTTGEIWVGDVGQSAREELNHVVKGGNYQWSYREGTLTGSRPKPESIYGNEYAPFLDYDRNVGGCIIGGMRYRGTKWASSLGGKVIFGDHIRGWIRTATPVENGTPVIQEIISNFNVGNLNTDEGLSNICTDNAGEVYLLDLKGHNKAGASIYKLVANAIFTEPPALLSQTGLFTNLTTLTPAPSLIPYDVATPLWSDGAAKRRWIILPNNGTHDTAEEKISFHESDNWSFPAGTVFVKHFEIPLDERNPSVTKRLETRIVVCTTDGEKYGLTYRWNSPGTDAQLLTAGENLDYMITLQDGSTSLRRWDFPSRADCMFCHTTAAGQSLGVRTHQVNRDFTYPATGRKANQLTTFNQLGMFDRTLTVTELENFLEARPLQDQTAPLEHRIRSYLDSNCSHCHQTGGSISYFDARLATPLEGQGIMDRTIQGIFVADPEARYIKPGSPSLSVIHSRLSAVGTGAAMPPLAKHVADSQAITRFQDYITSLNPSEFQLSASPQARYVRLTALSESIGRKSASVNEFEVLDGTGYPIPLSVQSIHSVSSEETVDEYAPAFYAIDGDPATYWHTEWGAVEPNYPHQITIDLGSIRSIGGFLYDPQTDPNSGRIRNYQVHYSSDATNWTLMTSGTWTNYTDPFRYDGLVGQRQTRCQIAGPSGMDGITPFPVTIVFDKNVTGFTPSDIQIGGGTVSKLRGKGYYYVATINPSTANVTVAVQSGVVTDSRGNTNRTSNTLSISQRTPFQQWAFSYGVDESNASLLADEDHDGVSKLLEYAFNLDPTRADRRTFDPILSPDKGLPYMLLDTSQTPPRLTLQYIRRKDGQGVTYQPQFGSFLTDFTNATGAPIIDPLNSTWERVTISDESQEQSTRFGRVEVKTP